MGTLEQKSKKRRKRANMQRAVLQVVKTVGFISVALLAPNVLGALKKVGVIPGRRHKDSVRRVRDDLVHKGYLQWKGNTLRITEKGQKRLQSLELKDYKLLQPRQWDGRWRVLIFDIPERRRMLRDKIRRTLMTLGFMRLQDSVWVYPHDCEDFVILFKSEFKIGRDMLYMIVDTIEYDTPIRARFNLT